MKRYSIFYFLAVFAIIVTGCSLDDNNPEYYNVLGTVDKSNDSVLIISDEDERLLVENSGSLSGINDNERLIAYFTLIEEPLPTGIDYIIDIVDISKVLYKPVIELTEEIADSIGNDPVDIESMWVAKDYLNVGFQYYGNNARHYINLTREPGAVDADTVELEFRHNNNNDAAAYLQKGLVTFDLESLQTPGADSVVLFVRAKEYSNHYYEKTFVYKF